MGGTDHAALGRGPRASTRHRARGAGASAGLLSRRAFMALGGAAALAGCDNAVGAPGAYALDARVDGTLGFLADTYPAADELRSKSAGLLVMPLVTEAALGAGAAYGRGALVIDGAKVDYYSATQASLGLQIGAQQYAHVLFFMTDGALLSFRTSPGWAAGADIEYAFNDHGVSAGADTLSVLTPVIATVFGQSGLLAGVSIEGTKYSRIIP